MMRFIRNTTLYKQIAEIRQVQSEMRRSTHRNSLRTKKMAVRFRMYAEVAHVHAERSRLTRDVMYVWSNINAVANVLTARLIKLDRIKQKVEQHDETMPKHLEKLRNDISAALDRAGVLADPAKSGSVMTHDFHTMLSERIQKMTPGGSENAVVRGFTSAALKDSIDKADKEHDTDEKLVFPQERLVASLVKELNLSPEELNQLLDSAGGSDCKSKELKSFVLSALKEAKVELKK